MLLTTTMNPVTVKLERYMGISFLIFTLPSGSEYDPEAQLPGLLPHLQKKNWWTPELERETIRLYPKISKG